MKRNIIHIHIPQTGGTWLSHNLQRCLAMDEDWIDSPDPNIAGPGTDGTPKRVVEWEWNWFLPPASRYSDGVLWNGYVGDIGHRSVEELSSGCADCSQFAGGILPASSFNGRLGTRWWNPKSGIEDAAMRSLFADSLKVSVCRNPYELMHSRWKKELRQRSKKPLVHFLEEYFNPDKKDYRETWQKNLFGQMYVDGVCGVDVILRNEHLSSALYTFLTKMKLCTAQRARNRIETTARYRHQNLSDYRKDYTTKSVDIIQQHCSYWLKTFGYDFDGRTSSRPALDCDCQLPKESDLFFAHTCLSRWE